MGACTSSCSQSEWLSLTAGEVSFESFVKFSLVLSGSDESGDQEGENLN